MVLARRSRDHISQSVTGQNQSYFLLQCNQVERSRHASQRTHLNSLTTTEFQNISCTLFQEMNTGDKMYCSLENLHFPRAFYLHLSSLTGLEDPLLIFICCVRVEPLRWSEFPFREPYLLSASVKARIGLK
jgi:hypothetical protein